ncbi:hypothetical protein [Hymenobacter sp. BRD67]|uniref:hypothetical protein n=1 Tax=Hymenobacter sp. BRD67 TaxID=2675877 RepID=UPI0015674DF5|nr:hypothetical protein [Hymenobacter sp. BRD67]QKG55080.1 hypothetical protein GKZ67_21900 [Hymenobacter sp. BRD67]
METNLRLRREALQFFAAYTLTDTRQTYDPTQPAQLPFVSWHRVVLTSMYEQEKNFRIGLEATYNGPQYVGDGSRQGRASGCGRAGRKDVCPAFFTGAERGKRARRAPDPVCASRKWSFYPTHVSPLYAPLDGFVGNAALKITL